MQLWLIQVCKYIYMLILTHLKYAYCFYALFSKKVFLGKFRLFIAKLVYSLSFTFHSLTREWLSAFLELWGLGLLPLEIKYLILLYLSWLKTGSFLHSKAMSKFIDKQQLILSIEIKPHPPHSPLPHQPWGFWHHYHLLNPWGWCSC